MPNPYRDNAGRSDGAGTYEGIVLFLTDLRVAWLLLNDARYRVLQRRLGIPRDQVNTVTLVAALMLAEGIAAQAQRAHQAVSHPPSATNSALSVAVLSDVVFRMIGGVTVRDAEVAGSLVLVVLAAKQLNSKGRTAIDDVLAEARRFWRSFDLRYGPRRA